MNAIDTNVWVYSHDIRGGIQTLYSEDFSDRGAFDGLTVVNPIK